MLSKYVVIVINPQKITAYTESHLTIGYLFQSNCALQIMVGFADPCTMPQHPGWPLRNFLALLVHQWSVQVQIVD